MSLLVDFARALERMKAHSMPTAHRMVMVAYTQHANAERRAWPSLATLHDETGIGRTKLREVIAELAEKHWLEEDGNAGEGLHRSARFIVHTDGDTWPDDSRQALRRSTDKARASRHANRKPFAARDDRCSPGDSVDVRRANVLPFADPASAVRAANTNPPGTLQKNPPEEPSRSNAREPARFEQQKIPIEDTADPPALRGDAPSKKPTRKAKKEPPPPEDPSTLDPRARAAYDAIASDESLRPICLGVVQLARDLCTIAPLADVAFEVSKAGVWLRGDPSDPRRRKTRGNAYLTNWISRAQERAEQAPRPAPPPPKEPKPEPYRAPRPDPPPGAKPVDWNEWQERLRRETDAWNARRTQGVSRG